MSKKFLIVKASSIGDIIQSFAVAEYLKSKFPGCQIDWVVEKRYEELVASHPFIHQVLLVDSYRWRKKWWQMNVWKEIFSFKKRLQQAFYEAIFDLQGNSKSALITAWAKGRAKVGFGWQSCPEKSNLLFITHRFNVLESLPIEQRYLSIVQQYYQDKNAFLPQGISLKLSSQDKQDLNELLSHSSCEINLMIAFGSHWSNKQLADETLVGFLQKIAKAIHPYFFFVWGNEREKQKAEHLAKLFGGQSKAIGKLKFSLWQGLMREVSCVIAMDSAALHLCATTKTPSFSVFGPSSSSVYKPLGKQHASIQGRCPYNEPFVKRCSKLRTCATGACMKNLEVEALFQSFMNHLKNQNRSQNQLSLHL